LAQTIKPDNATRTYTYNIYGKVTAERDELDLIRPSYGFLLKNRLSKPLCVVGVTAILSTLTERKTKTPMEQAFNPLGFRI
jgi:YD repeat-containing protein